jgi:hypothetical protein
MMEYIKQGIEFLTWAAHAVPLWGWQVAACILATFMVMPFLKLTQSLLWDLSPRTRRAINALITVPVGGAITLWLYDQPGRDYALIFIMFSNMGLYKGLTKLSEHNKDKGKLWFLLYYWLRPFDLYEVRDGVEKAVDIASDTTIIDTVENLNTTPTQAEDR